jgi:hypothetical protein
MAFSRCSDLTSTLLFGIRFDDTETFSTQCGTKIKSSLVVERPGRFFQYFQTLYTQSERFPVPLVLLLAQRTSRKKETQTFLKAVKTINIDWSFKGKKG